MDQRRRTTTLIGAVLTAAVVSGLAGVPGLDSAEARTAAVTRTWILERTTDGPSRLTLQGGLDFIDGDRAYAAATFLRPNRRGRLVSSPFSFIHAYGTDYVPVVYHDGDRRFHACTALREATSEPCPLGRAFGGAAFAVSYSDRGGRQAASLAVVVVRGRAADVNLAPRTTRGWRIREANLSVRANYVEGDSTQASGAGTFTGSAEAFFSSTARGFRRGSVAIGQPPCGSIGVGRVDLTGGVRPASVTCPLSNAGVSAVAHAPTRWRLRGPAAGANTFQQGVRLLVTQLPQT